MVTIIPAINASDFEEVEEQFAKALLILPQGGWIHIDIADGEFTPHHTWNKPEQLKKLVDEAQELAPFNFEIHLMVQNPEKAVESWLHYGGNRIIIHAEAMTDDDYILGRADRHAADIMLAINPASPAEKLLAYKNQFHFFQILAVSPGSAGQKFKPEVLEKIRVLREKVPHAKIEVDGGINPETAKLCKEAGANLFVSASYIFGSNNPRQAYEELAKVISN